MSLQIFKQRISPYLQNFPQHIEFRVQLIQKDFLHNKGFFYFGPSLGQMRHGTYGICFKIDNNNGNLLIYQGPWQKDQYNGKGSLFLISIPRQNSHQFFRWSQGTWKNGKLQGKCIIRQYNLVLKQWQTKYTGQFVQNHKHGKGIQYFNNNRYQGNFLHGCKHGHGRLIDENGNFYDGNFEEGFPKGQGLQLKGGMVTIKDKSQRQMIYLRPSQQELPGFITKTIKNL